MARWTITTLLDRFTEVLADKLGLDKTELITNPGNVSSFTAEDIINILKDMALMESMVRRTR